MVFIASVACDLNLTEHDSGGWPMLSLKQTAGAQPFSRSLREGGAFSRHRGSESRLPRRPLQIPAAQQVHVQVEDRLPGTRADVEHGPVAIFNAALACDVCGDELAAAD